MRAVSLLAVVTLLLLPAEGGSYRMGGGSYPIGFGSHLHAQQPSAPIDLTGTWVSVISEDWHLRMITPPKGNFEGMTVNDAARKIAAAWEPAKDEADGNACRAYGAAGVMRLPGRVRFSWQDANTLRLETDAGQQTRLFRFGDAAAPPGEAGWQGHSVATWEVANAPTGRGGGPAKPAGGRLKVVTTNLKPGYLRKNGVPYSGDAVVTEYFNMMTDPTSNDQWFTVTTIVRDPTYLLRDHITSSNFKKEADSSKWRPRPCMAR
jgi:hypothetical protein